MKKITLIKITGCPYCAAAFRAIDELKTANSAYAAADIEVLDENLQPELAGKFTDYYYVPTMYVDGKKIYEAHPGESYDECFSNVKKVFEVAL